MIMNEYKYIIQTEGVSSVSFICASLLFSSFIASFHNIVYAYSC